MPFAARRVRRTLSALPLAAALVCLPTFAWAQTNENPPAEPATSPVAPTAPTAPATPATGGSKIDLTLETGATPAPAPAPVKKAAPKPAPKAATPKKTASRYSGGARVTSLPLPSRGVATRTSIRQEPQPAPKVLAQLGVVLVDQVQIRVNQDPSSRLLSVAPKGTHLAVVADMGDYWGVLMVNNTVGWLPKSQLELINYQTEVTIQPEPAPVAPTAASSAAGSPSIPTDLTPRQQALLKEAFTYMGVPYVWAGNTRSGIDCSGFVKNVFSTQGLSLPRHSGDQAKVGRAVAGNDLRAGDRLYFDMKHVGQVSHTGIYIGNGYFVHSSTNHHGVGVDSIFKPGYLKALVAIRRDFE